MNAPIVASIAVEGSSMSMGGVHVGGLEVVLVVHIVPCIGVNMFPMIGSRGDVLGMREVVLRRRPEGRCAMVGLGRGW